MKQTMNNSKTFIFDMDGTIFDSMYAWINCGERYISSLGLKPEPDLGKKLLSMNMTEGAEYLKRKYLLNISLKEICDGINNTIKDAYSFEVQFKPGAKEFLQELKKHGKTTVLCTNTDRCTFKNAFKRLGVESLFDIIHTTSEMQMSKSNPEIFIAIANETNSTPKETWVFEDSLYAIRTAFNAGFNTAGIYDEYSKHHLEQIKKHSTNFFNNYQEVMNYFFN